MMERGDALSTLQTFQGYLSDYPKSSEVPQVRKALAEAYLILRKYDEAANEYNTIIKDFPKTEHAREAKYRMGDVYFAKKDFSGAIRAFETAIKDLPADEKVFPNANFIWLRRDLAKGLQEITQQLRSICEFVPAQ